MCKKSLIRYKKTYRKQKCKSFTYFQFLGICASCTTKKKMLMENMKLKDCLVWLVKFRYLVRYWYNA